MDGADTSCRWVSPAVIRAPGKILAVLGARPGLVAGSQLSFAGARLAPPQHRGSVLAAVLVDAAKHLGLVQASPDAAAGGGAAAARAISLWTHDTKRGLAGQAQLDGSMHRHYDPRLPVCQQQDVRSSFFHSHRMETRSRHAPPKKALVRRGHRLLAGAGGNPWVQVQPCKKDRDAGC